MALFPRQMKLRGRQGGEIRSGPSFDAGPGAVCVAGEIRRGPPFDAPSMQLERNGSAVCESEVEEIHSGPSYGA